MTEGTRPEQDLQHEHDRFQAVFEEAFDAMVIADDSGQFIDANRSATALFGLQEPDLLGRSIDEFAPENYDFEAAWRAFQQSDDERGTFPLVRPDGTERIVEYAATTDIVPGQHLSVLRDITEREQREGELREQTRYLQGVLDSVEAAIWIRDTDSRFKVANQNTRDLFEIDDGVDLNGLSLMAVLPEDVAVQFRENDERVLEQDAPMEFEEEVQTVEGHRTYLTRIVPLYDDEEVVATCGVATDITELKRNQQELERINEQLDGVVSIASHDLRNPLNVASGRLELARAERDSEDLEAVKRSHDRMEALIEDLLTLAREGKRVGVMEAVPLKEIVAACWDVVETADATLVNETNQIIMADRSRVHQLLENLFRNAVEHVGPDVVITVGELEDGFFVEDNGPGIPSDVRDQIFTAGYSTDEAGTGFGLSIVKEIVGAHGWSIQLSESSSGGARFEITGGELNRR